ncbi:hypothetical protein KJ665_00755 [Patescibacteria group bacterium]|nr:hypothetical protein [Patescibacteria group bacterium]
MPRRKTTKENIRNIQRSGGSYHISIPIAVMRELKWKERQKVVVKKHGQSKILIVDWKK